MLWNAAWYLSSGYERNDPRGPESRVYGVVWEIATVQQCLFHAGSTRKHRGKGCRNLFLKELGTDSFRSALSHTYCTQSPLYFLSLSIRLSIFLWFIETIERKADLVEIFFRRNRRFCWNSKSLKSVGERLFCDLTSGRFKFFEVSKIFFSYFILSIFAILLSWKFQQTNWNDEILRVNRFTFMLFMIRTFYHSWQKNHLRNSIF